MFSGKEYHLFWHCGNFKNILKYSALAPTPPPYIIAFCLFVLSLQCPLERSLCHIRCSTLQPTKRANCMTYPSGKGPICQTRPSAKMHMCLSKALGCPSQIIPIIQSLLKNPTKNMRGSASAIFDRTRNPSIRKINKCSRSYQECRDHLQHLRREILPTQQSLQPS